MPTVFRIHGFRVMIYPNDHRPAHVHVIGAGGEAVFNLNCPKGPIELREVYELSRQELGRIEKALSEHLTDLCDRWSEIHGDQ